jgi:serine/threonine-protein kinase RsbW
VNTDGHAATLTVPADARSLAVCRAALSGALATVDAPDSVVDDLRIVVSEICANVVRHAYPTDCGQIEVTLVATDARIEVSVSDAGVGMPARPVADGTGLSLLRALTTDSTVGPGAGGRGTTVRFTRSL